MMTTRKGFKLGKLAPKHDDRTFKLAKYLPVTLEPPANCDWTLKVAQPCGMMLNDTIGDCTCAAVGHEIQVATANHGVEVTVPDANILGAYIAITGYDPTAALVDGENPTDTGAAMLDVLKYWRTVGVNGHKIMAYAKVDLTDWLRVQQAIYLFGGIYTGLALPKSLDEDAPVWFLPPNLLGDNAPGTMGGHCTFTPSYTGGQLLKTITWGGLQPLSYEWLRVYADEGYVVVTYDWASQAMKAPNGFDLATLLADLHGLNN